MNMKELSIEEKAKRFDEALERANSLLSSNQLGNAWIYKLLPELKESEDEKIRNAIITLLKEVEEDETYCGTCHIKKYIAWLEKQGGQKSSEWSEIEPIIQHLDNLGNTAMADILRSFEPQPKQKWKPSEEQMKALENAIRYGEEENIGILSLLYNDLKKLKG